MARAVGLNHVTLIVDDLERAVAFYRDELGLQPLPAYGFDYPAAFFRINDTQQLHVSEWKDAVSQRGHPCLVVDDWGAAFRRFRELGIIDIEAWGKVHRLPDGTYQMFIRDPAGNLLEISAPPDADVDAAIFQDDRFCSGSPARGSPARRRPRSARRASVPVLRETASRHVTSSGDRAPVARCPGRRGGRRRTPAVDLRGRLEALHGVLVHALIGLRQLGGVVPATARRCRTIASGQVTSTSRNATPRDSARAQRFVRGAAVGNVASRITLRPRCSDSSARASIVSYVHCVMTGAYRPASSGRSITRGPVDDGPPGSLRITSLRRMSAPSGRAMARAAWLLPLAGSPHMTIRAGGSVQPTAS